MCGLYGILPMWFVGCMMRNGGQKLGGGEMKMCVLGGGGGSESDCGLSHVSYAAAIWINNVSFSDHGIQQVGSNRGTGQAIPGVI